MKADYINTPASLSGIEQALSFIDSHDRETWLHCGMGIKSELGDAGFDVWDSWSAGADSYDPRAAKASWKGFSEGGGRTIATLFRLAMDNGYVHNSNDKPAPATPEQIAAREAARNKDIADKAKRNADAAAQSANIWDARPIGGQLEALAPAVSEHPYLVKQGIKAHGAKVYRGSLTIGGMSCNGALMIPISKNGKITSLQFISKDGEKRFIPGGEKGWYVIGKITPGVRICIAEGFATGASIHEATGYPVVICFDAGNMLKVAEALRAKFPDAVIALCADDDSAKDDTGLKAANRAALAVGGLVAVTVWGADKSAGDNDFNDMAKLYGLDAVKLAIDAAKPVDQQAVGCNSNHSCDGSNTNTRRPTPEPLPTLPDVLPFDYAYLPDALRGYVKDISERMQCPPDFAAVGVMVMMATIIGRKVSIRPKRNDDWVVTCNLWGAVVGNSGVMKSPTLSAALAPIGKLAAAAFEDFNKASAQHAEVAELAKLQQSVNKTKAKASLKNGHSADASKLLQAEDIDGAPVLKRYKTNNASYEALGELLMENPNGLLVEADEIIGLLKQLDAGGQEVARSFYLTAADGDKSYTFDRIMRGKGLHIEALCLSIIGGIQPGVLAEYVRQATSGGAGADGLLQRFSLMVYPDISPECKYVDRFPDSALRESVNRLAERMDNLDPTHIGAEVGKFGGVPFLRFDDPAQAVFAEWIVELDTRLRSGEEHPAIASHLSKYRKLIPSLALINHLCDTSGGAVTEQALIRSIAFSEYLESHAMRIYSNASRPEMDAAKTVLKRLAKGKLPNIFTSRDLSQKSWAGLETASKAQAAIDLLLEYRHLSEEEIKTGGRPTTHYHWIKAVLK